MIEFQQLLRNHEIFRDTHSDFSPLEDSQSRLLEREIWQATRRYEELKNSKDDILLVGQEIKINLLNCKIRQIEILNCNFILDKLKDINTQFTNSEINIYYYTHLPKYENKIRVHRQGCLNLASEFNNVRISENYHMVPWQSVHSFRKLALNLFEKDLYVEDGKYYCGTCLSHVSIPFASVDFEKSKLELEKMLNQLQEELLLCEAKKKSIDTKNKQIESSITSSNLTVLSNIQSVAVKKLKNAFLTDWKSKNPPKVITTPLGQLEMRYPVNFHFGGFPIGDDKLFFGVGFETWRGEDLCVSYQNWHLLDAQGKEILMSEMTEEERLFAEAERICGPGSAAPMSI
jgi:hypothetical protein